MQNKLSAGSRTGHDKAITVREDLGSHQSGKGSDSRGVEESEHEHCAHSVAPEWSANYCLLPRSALDVLCTLPHSLHKSFNGAAL